MFARVFRSIEEVFSQIVKPMDATNAALLHILEVDSRQLCETAEGLVGGGLVLEQVRQVVTSMAERCKHQEAPQDTNSEEPLPEMTVIDDRDEPRADEPEHQNEEDAKTSLP